MSLSLEAQIGQMLWFGWQGETAEAARTVTAHARALLDEFQVGGVILMGRNLGGPAQVAALTTELQAGSALPLLIGTDQEGGAVTRMPSPGFTFPGNMALGALDDPETVREVTTAMGEQLVSMGINVDFAPVLDVNNNPENPIIGTRSFGEDPERVAALGAAALQGFRRAGVIACGKHFPGHGDTAVDSHLDLPIQSAPRSRLDAVELAPFRAAIAAGTPLLMTAHILFPSLDDRWPATLSPAILTGLLRRELGYESVVVTDCLEMNGIASHFGVEEAALQAVEAGADCLLACHTPETQRRIHRSLLDAARTGRLPGERIAASVERILALKAAYGLADRRRADPVNAGQTVGAARYRELERRVARRAVTVVKDDHGWLPVGSRPLLVVGPARTAGRLVEALEELGANARRADRESASPAPEETSIWMLLPSEAKDPDALESLRRWLGQGRRVVVVAARAPYPLAACSDAPCQVAIYGEADCSVSALAEVLVGQARGEGRMPVSLVMSPRNRYNA